MEKHIKEVLEQSCKNAPNLQEGKPLALQTGGLVHGFGRKTAPLSASLKRQLGQQRLVRVVVTLGVLAISACAWLYQSQQSVPSETPVVSTPDRGDVVVEAKAAVAPLSTPDQAIPEDALVVLKLVLQGGPFPFEKDGTVFGNRERLLPNQPRGYYREYTVAKANAPSRGAKRIVCGGFKPTRPDQCYYTADHYASFERIEQLPMMLQQ